MAQNKSVDLSVPSVENYRLALDFYNKLSAEARAALPGEDSDDWFPEVVEAMIAAMSDEDETDPNAKGPRKPRTAQHYTVLILSPGIAPVVVGSGFGPVSKEKADRKEKSVKAQLEYQADLRITKMALKGTQGHKLTVLTSELPEWMVPAEDRPAAQQESTETAPEATASA